MREELIDACVIHTHTPTAKYCTRRSVPYTYIQGRGHVSEVDRRAGRHLPGSVRGIDGNCLEANRHVGLAYVRRRKENEIADGFYIYRKNN